ncbi:MAG TPA: CHASE2 domain-containing protein [Tepidisphaeraceae bacterium]|jgi:class 3 adenylate cyclase|nr:CHASE2 domain-containing protein [Tepidisphaeraceae bacterium]
MTRTERRLLVDTSILGLALTFLVTFLDFAGLLSAPERFFYDFRARHFQRYTPPPTTQLVHIDIDDKSLSEMGHWPWPRSRLAEIVDEIRIGGAKTMVLDVMLSEPNPFELDSANLPAATQSATKPTTKAVAPPTTQPATRLVATSQPHIENRPTSRPATAPIDATALVQLRMVDNDKMLANSLAQFGQAVVPLSLNLNAAPNNDSIYLAMMEELSNDPEGTHEQLLEILCGRGFERGEVESALNSKYTYARDEGMFLRIARECGESILSFEELRRRILPKLDPQISGSVQLRLLKEQYDRFAAVQALRRFAVKIPPGYPNLINTREEHATIKVLADAGWTTGFFDFVRPVDGTVRFIPLLANHHGYAFPQMGLSLACAMLDVKPKDLIITKNSITIPCQPTPIVIPVHLQETYRGSYDMFIDIPWFGPPVDSGWQRMYDWPNHLDTKQHVPIHFIWEACETRHRIAANNRTADRAMRDLAAKLGSRTVTSEVTNAAARDPSEPLSRFAAIDAVIAELQAAGWLSEMDKGDEQKLTDEEKDAIAAYRSLRLIQRENERWLRYLNQRRGEIREFVEGKAALIGWIAVGAIADVIPTSLHSQCPGVVAHGVIFNAIMTRDLWRRPPYWVTPLITALMGVLVTAIVSMFPPWRALAATAALAGGYFAFNASYLFDNHNLIVGVAGPVTVALVVWAGGTLARFILEAGLRAQVTRNFSMRVDPQLVKYVLERDAKVDGQVKELTVVFTDLAGFTSLSEQLKEETVPLLNEYMALMVPVIRRHKGYLNKFLGDGIMYFFGAPYENPNHAFDGVMSVLEMQEVMVVFNTSLTTRGLPNMAVRAGISAGNMVVGDAGAEDTHDYTVLGDAVNLGARLEPANKVFGTQILMNARARELCGERILFRPIGRIQVMGKSEGVMTYEPLALAEKATDRQKELADLTSEIVISFMNANFQGCLAAVAKMEETFGASKLGSLYRRISEQYLREGAPAGFDGQIVLSEK